MELYQLKYFHTLCRYGKYSRAAQELYISPSALSSAVKKLEAELGLPLIDRNAPDFTLLPAGEALLACCGSILNELDILQEQLDKLAGQAVALRIAVEHMAFSGSFMEALDSFSQQYPQVQVAVSRRDGDTIRQLVNSRKLDIGIVIHQDSQYPGLSTEPYCEAEYGLYCGKPQAETVISTRTLAGKELTLLNNTGDMAAPLKEYFLAFDVRPAKSSVTNIYPDASWPLIRAGLGSAVYPMDLHRIGDGIFVYPFDPPLTLRYDFVTPPHSPIARALKLLKDFLLSRAGKELP
ncbi:MAG: LysR family transcriptional regulator [Lachnospiraceae bacterium]|nr:LysR family transcriptional regulator [Lachnospiraceae bacterium]